jgi:hypothetical protein
MFFYCNEIFLWNPYFHFAERRASTEQLWEAQPYMQSDINPESWSVTPFFFTKSRRHNSDKKCIQK